MIDTSKLVKIIGDDYVITQRDRMENYLYDETPLAVRPKAAGNIVVVKPGNTGEISDILKLANATKTPVFVRGGGTGLCGAAVPTTDGVVISMERLNKIIEIDKENLMAVGEGGATLGDLIKAADGANLFFPPHPGDEGAQLGGLVACNAGGARAVKYGVIRNYVKGLEVVLPTGEIVNLGGKLLKNNQGLDLMHLMINSSGILGVITKVIFRLYPKSPGFGTLVISYDNRHDAIDTVPELLRSGIIPLAVEYVEKEVIEISAEHLGMHWPAQKGQAHLIITLTGSSDDDVYQQAEQVSAIAEKHNAVDTLMAERKSDQDNILKMRSEIYSANKARSAELLDITVPPASIGDIMDRVDAVAEKYQTQIPLYGHVGDGNFHAHLLNELNDRGLVHQVKREIYTAAIAMGGVITGEHGIGRTRVPDLDLTPYPKTWELMRAIKVAFDPNNILNPGVLLK
jgi:glycolate oxidase